MATKERPQTISTGRIEAFSDGVFAIAVTLLALQLQLPTDFPTNPTEHQLLDALVNLIPSYFTLILSFIVIGRYWIAHHSIFNRIERGDTGLAMINLLLLLTVVIIPFPTELLGNYGDLTAAAVFYAVSLSLVGLMMTAVSQYAVKHKLMYKTVSSKKVSLHTRQALVVPAVFLLSVPIILIDVTAGELFWYVALFVGLFMRTKD